LPSSSFCFIGFLPTKPAARQRALESLARSRETTVLFESPRRTASLVGELARRLGPRLAFIGRELTKLHEEHWFGTLEELSRELDGRTLKGEVTLVVAPGADPGGAALRDPASIETRFAELTALGLSRREAVKAISREAALPAREVYRLLLRVKH
jgi:16S rRNA (cytidine1402-2'-O)-methyltransferase